MTVKGTLIATLAAGYIATLAPAAHADDKAPPAGDKAGGEHASCKGENGCKGKKAKKGDKKEEGKKDEKKAEEKK
jgi:hypothetical protein